MKKLTNKEKILLAASVAGIGVAGYLAIKYKIDTTSLKNRVKILEEIVSEDVLEEAIATTTRKFNYRIDKIKVYETRVDEESIAKLNEHIKFKEIFEKRLKDFNELKRLRYIEK